MASCIRTNVALSLGMITTVVRIHSARHSKEYLSNACQNGHSPSLIKQPKTCDHCGVLSHGAPTVKVRKMADKSLMVVDDTELAEVADDAAQWKGKIQLMPYPAADVMLHTGSGDKFYYAEPQASGDNYALIASVCENTSDKLFLAKFTVNTVASLFMLQVKNGVLLLAERTFSDALKNLPQINETPNQQFIPLAAAMVDAMDCTFTPDTFADTYKRGLDNLLNVKAGVVEKEPVSAEMLRRALVEYRQNQEAKADA